MWTRMNVNRCLPCLSALPFFHVLECTTVLIYSLNKIMLPVRPSDQTEAGSRAHRKKLPKEKQVLLSSCAGIDFKYLLYKKKNWSFLFFPSISWGWKSKQDHSIETCISMQSICCLCSTLIHLPAEISLLISKNILFKAGCHLRKICSFTCSLFLMPTVLVHSCWMSCTLFHSNKNPILRDNLWLQCFVIWVVNLAGHHFTYRWKPKECGQTL